MQTLESGYVTTLAAKLAAADTTMTVATAPTVTKGRLFLKSGSVKEWIKFTGVSGTTLTGLVRGLSKTADPSTSGTGLTWVAGTTVTLVEMHDQMSDKQEGMPVKVYATTTDRDADITAPSNGMQVYVTAEGQFTDYVAGAWVNRASGTNPNASATAAGKVEIATQAEFDAGTATGGTGASLVSTPDFTQKQINTATAKTTMVGADSFGIADSADSGKIKRVTLTQLLATTDAQATTTTSGVVEKATDAEVVTGTDTARYMDVKQTTDLVLNTGFVASDNLKISADTSRNAVVNGTQAKLKEIQIGDNYSHGGTIRVKFDLIYVPGSWSGTARIYKNGSAVGTNRATTTSWVTHSEDLTFAAGDLIQLYAQTTTDGTTSVRNFQLFFDEVKYAKLGTVITD